MTTELAVHNGTTAPAIPAAGMLTPAGEAMARLGEWVQLGDQAHALVTRLASSAFIPAAYKTGDAGTVVANATAAVLYGLSLGWDPMTSLQQVYIVHGRPGLYAKAKVALLQSRGYEVATLDLTKDTATVAVRRPGAAEFDKPVTITMQDAIDAGWTSNAAYKKTPADMLWARAAGRACDRSGAAVLLGIATVEDIADTEPIRAEAMVTVQPRRGADLIAGQPTTPAQPAAVPAASSAPAAEPVDIGDVPMTAEQMISPERSRHLHDLAKAQGRNTRAKLSPIIKKATGRDVADTKDLTAAEGELVIAELQPAPEAETTPDGEAWPEVAQPPLEA